jgi:hypothetical protein
MESPEVCSANIMDGCAVGLVPKIQFEVLTTKTRRHEDTKKVKN